MTRWTSVCDRIIEAGWLVALVTTPLFFNSYSFRSFEPDKTGLLRSIALVMAAAWVIKRLDGIRSGASPSETSPGNTSRLSTGASLLVRSGAENVVVLCAVLLLLDQVLATVVSISPSTSLWGSYLRLQGLYTWGAYLVVFLSMVSLLKTREQFDRAMTTILMVSCPVAVYGLIQHHGMDPIVWARDVIRPVMSTMGNAIFLAGFLIVIIPLTLYRLLEAATAVVRGTTRFRRGVVFFLCVVSIFGSAAAWWGSLVAGAGTAVVITTLWLGLAAAFRRSTRAGVAVAVYTVLLSVQVAAVLLSESRGPFLGLISGLFFFAFFLAIARKKWKWNVSLIGVASVLLLVVVLINVPHSPLEFIKQQPVIGRLSSVFETGGTGRVRLLLWEQSVDAIRAEPIRTTVGYGPDTIRLALAPHYLPELGTVESKDALADRAHNETYDFLITTGLIGVALYYAFILAIFCFGLRRLGAVTSSRSAMVLLSVSVGSAVGLALLTRLADESWRLLGIVLPVGVLIGVAGYLSAYSIRRIRSPQKARTEMLTFTGCLPIVALLSAIAGHFVEIHFAIATVSTRMYFWSLVGLCLCAPWIIGKGDKQSVEQFNEAEEMFAEAAILSSGRREFGAALAVFSLIVCTICFDFTSIGNGLWRNPGFVWLLGVTFALSALLLLVHAWPFQGRVRGSLALMQFIGLCGGVVVLSLLLSHIIYKPTAPANINVYPALIWYFVTVLLLQAVIGLCLRPKSTKKSKSAGALRTLSYPALFLAALFAIWMIDLKALQADVFFKRGWLGLTQESDFDNAIDLTRRALELAPDQDHYYTYLARALSDKAVMSRESDLRDKLFAEAEVGLLKARRLSPRDPDYAANLGRLFRKRATHSNVTETRIQYSRRAIGYFQDALDLTPGRPKLWNELGAMHTLIGEHEKALAKYEHALSLDSSFVDTYLLLGNTFLMLGNWENAREVLEQAVHLSDPSADLHMTLGNVYERLSRLDDAVEQYESALRIGPTHRGAYGNLIRLYLRTGNCEAATKRVSEMATLLPGDRWGAAVARVCNAGDPPTQ